jgi:hypothetical protein
MILKKDSFFEISFLKEMCFDVYWELRPLFLLSNFVKIMDGWQARLASIFQSNFHITFRLESDGWDRFAIRIKPFSLLLKSTFVISMWYAISMLPIYYYYINAINMFFWLDFNKNVLSFGERTPVRLSYKTCELEKPDDQTCWKLGHQISFLMQK